MSDLCTGVAAPDAARERILAWLAEGAREVSWALCSFPRDRWAEAPPTRPGAWPALRHARYLALREAYLTLPAVRQALGDEGLDKPAPAELEQAEAAWDAAAAIESAEAIVRGLGETRFELLQRLEAAPDEAWEFQLNWLMLHARQHELEHLAAIWGVALYWHRGSPAAAGQSLSFSLHPADRPEESH